MTFRDITHSDDLEADLELLRQTLTGEIHTYQMEKRYLHKNGQIVWVLLSVSLVSSSSGEPSYFISQIQDITGRKAAEEQLRRPPSSLPHARRAAASGHVHPPVDMAPPTSTRARSSSPCSATRRRSGRATRSCSRASSIPTTASACSPPQRPCAKPASPPATSTATSLATARVWVQDETFRVLDEQGEPSCQGFLLDITERRDAESERDRLREALHDAQKLEAIGRLAGGVAHDFNNMLTAIKGYSELLLAGLEPGTRPHHEAEQIRRAAEQASSLPEQLLAFARKQPLEAKLVDVNALVADGERALLRHLIGERIELIMIPAPHPRVRERRPRSDRTDAGQPCSQCPRRDADRRLADDRDLDDRDPDEALGRDEGGADREETAGSYVVISVADDGQGMDADTRDRAFEPFFTTKPQGKGSGLGLASVHGTVSQSGGSVRARERARPRAQPCT